MNELDYYTAFRERARVARAYGHACDRSRIALNRFNQDRTPENRCALMAAIEDCDRKYAELMTTEAALQA